MNVSIPCTCPPKADGEPRHATDTVTFRERIGLEGGLAIRKGITMLKVEDPNSGAAEVLASMSVHYLVHGIESWTRVDARGKPLECDKTAIRQFLDEHDDIAANYLVDEADNLYSERHLLPLVQMAQNSSPPSQTEPSTSAGTGSPKPKPSRRSSISTTPTNGITTTTTPPAGDSSTSLRSA